MKTCIYRFAAFSLVAALAGCGGGNPSSASPRAGTSQAQVSVTIKLDGSAKTSSVQRAGRAGSRLPRYVSEGTNGLEITAYSAGSTPPTTPTTYADVSATSSLCGSTNADGTRTCTVPLTAPVGNDDFLVTATDQPPQSKTAPGNSLSTGTLNSFAITAGATNTVSITLDGIIATITPEPPVLSTAADGLAHTLLLGVNAQDADGFFIVDVSPFANPLTATVTGDTNNTLTVNAPPSGADPTHYTVTYTGGALANGTITFSATGAASGVANVTPIVVTPTSLTLTHGTGTASLAASQALYIGAVYASSTNPTSCVTVTNPMQPTPPPGSPGPTYTFNISAAVATTATTCAILVSGLNNAVFSVPVTVQ